MPEALCCSLAAVHINYLRAISAASLSSGFQFLGCVAESMKAFAAWTKASRFHIAKLEIGLDKSRQGCPEAVASGNLFTSVLQEPAEWAVRKSVMFPVQPCLWFVGISLKQRCFHETFRFWWISALPPTPLKKILTSYNCNLADACYWGEITTAVVVLKNRSHTRTWF